MILPKLTNLEEFAFIGCEGIQTLVIPNQFHGLFKPEIKLIDPNSTLSDYFSNSTWTASIKKAL